MKIINQSFEPIIQTDDHIANIAAASRICYKSEDKALKDETPFVNGLIKGAHNSTLEMSVVHFKIADLPSDEVNTLFESKFLEIIMLGNWTYCTGSIRAWREFILTRKDCGYKKLTSSIVMYLYNTIAKIFTEDLIPFINTTDLFIVDPFTIDKLSSLLIRKHKDEVKNHIHQGIRIVTNRSVTHEIVRHRPCSYLQESQRYCRYNDDVVFIAPTAFWKEGTEAWSEWANACKVAEDYYLQALLRGASAQAARLILPNSCKTEIIVYCSLQQWEHILAMRHSSKADKPMQELMKPLFDWFVETYPEHFTVKENLQRSIG